MNEKPTKTLPVLDWTPALSQQFWGRLAGTTFLERIAFSRFAAPYLVELVKSYFPENSRVLDYGSGYNLYLVRELLKQGFRTAFYEPSVPADEQIRFIEQDARFLGAVTEVSPGEFDVVFLSEVIEHLFDDEIPATLSRLHDSLSSNGILVVTTPCNENLFEASRFCPTCEHLFHPWGHVRSFSPESLEKLLGEHGFRCEAQWNVDLSGTRNLAEELISLKDRIARLVAKIEETSARGDAETPQAAALAASVTATFQDVKGAFDTRDPARCQIGFGGTIVIVARRQAM